MLSMNPVGSLAAITLVVLLAACSPALATPANPPSPSAVEPSSTLAPSPLAYRETAVTPTAPTAAAAPAARYRGLEQGLTDEGFPYLGALTATLTITDYSGFL